MQPYCKGFCSSLMLVSEAFLHSGTTSEPVCFNSHIEAKHVILVASIVLWQLYKSVLKYHVLDLNINSY